MPDKLPETATFWQLGLLTDCDLRNIMRLPVGVSRSATALEYASFLGPSVHSAVCVPVRAVHLLPVFSRASHQFLTIIDFIPLVFRAVDLA